MKSLKQTDDLSYTSLNSKLDNTEQPDPQPTSVRAEGTPERKANMLTQFPWIPSDVFLGISCQTNSMILSLFLILVFPFSFFPSLYSTPKLWLL